MIYIKEGVRLIGIQVPMMLAVLVAHEVFRDAGHDLVITSATDGKHMRASLHYVGAALDFRLPDDADGDELRQRIAGALGSDYDVVNEGDHLHVEWQPKEPY